MPKPYKEGWGWGGGAETSFWYTNFALTQQSSSRNKLVCQKQHRMLNNQAGSHNERVMVEK